MTDSQVADEKFLVLINDMLASGEIPGLFADDAMDEIIGAMRNEVKSAGIDDTRENIWRYFIEKVRRNLKVVLCFSPVGTTLRVRSRKFPAITNSTSIDWYHEWPEVWTHLCITLNVGCPSSFVGSLDFRRQSVRIDVIC